jgi:methylmalonyl-CoA/ethylmalonyl-CoA epimerase
MIKKIHHLAFAVNDLEAGARFYRDVLGLAFSGPETVVAQKAKVGFLEIGESSIELVQPTEEGSPLTKFLKAKGPGMHHICFEVDDIEAEVKVLMKRGVAMVDEKPRPGARGSKVAFIHPSATSGVLIELCELPRGDQNQA